MISLAQFQEDNESIVDEDLVSWITLGVNHIPTAEDIPVTTTGMTEHVKYDQKFYLLSPQGLDSQNKGTRLVTFSTPRVYFCSSPTSTLKGYMKDKI